MSIVDTNSPHAAIRLLEACEKIGDVEVYCAGLVRTADVWGGAYRKPLSSLSEKDSRRRLCKCLLSIPVAIIKGARLGVFTAIVIVVAQMALLTVLMAEEKGRFTNERHAYMRGEEIRIVFRTGAEKILFTISGLLPEYVKVVDGTAVYSINSSLLRSGEYEIHAQEVHGEAVESERASFPITISPKPNPQRYPVWHWGSVKPEEMEYWTKRGFNGFSIGAVRSPIRESDNFIAQTIAMLEAGTLFGADIGVHFDPLRWKELREDKDSMCLLPSGQRDSERVYPLEPKVVDRAQETVQSWINRFWVYPSLRHALLSSEYETPFCVNEITRKLAEQEANIDPEEYFKPKIIEKKSGRVNRAYLHEEKLPKNGVISEDNPVYRLLTWWWKSGNGIRKLNAMMAETIHSKRPDILTWHDPYRLSPVYGTHSGLGAISTWTYGHPDIKRLIYTRVLQAVAKRDNLKVMQTVTLYVYDRFVMPARNSLLNILFDKPDGNRYFTNSPDYAREATWLVFSQRPDILSYFYASSLRPNTSSSCTSKTSPQTFQAIGEISRALIEPYGPAMVQCQPRKAKVAVLLSASAIWFSRKSVWYGYPNESILPYCILLLMNHIPFDVLLDEDVAGGGLSEYDLLIIPCGDALTQGVHQRIVDFARRGKKVVADKSLQASVPGASLIDIDFSFQNLVDGRLIKEGDFISAEEYETRMEKLAQQMERLLTEIVRPWRSSQKRVIFNEVRSGNIRYVFIINDLKTYGPRFGQWKLMQELGVEQIPRIRIEVEGKPAIYDALGLAPVEYSLRDSGAEFEITLPPAGGKLVAVLPNPIQHVQIIAPASVERGIGDEVRGIVFSATGTPIMGAVPLRIDVTDPLGRQTEYSRYAATVYSEGQGWSSSAGFLPAINDVPGEWTITMSELLSGITAQSKIVVR